MKLIWYVLLITVVVALEDSVGEKFPISVLMLAWKNPLTLKHTLQSYKKAGFFNMASEFVLFFNEITETKIKSVREYPLRVIGSSDNVYIAVAMQMLFAAAQYPYALFVEKDFSIELDHTFVAQELKIALDTIQSKSVVVYHLRSQSNPGKPLSARTSYEGKEDLAVSQNSVHLCTFSSWIENTVERWPEVFKRCGPHKVICVDSANCNWTNNPFLVSVEFWQSNMIPAITQLYRKHPLLRHTKVQTSDFDHLLEPFFRDPKLWADKHFKVATGKGIFTHYEVDN